MLDLRRPSWDLLKHLLEGVNTWRLVYSESDEEQENSAQKDGSVVVCGEEFASLLRERARWDAGRLAEVPPR